jgi:GNAT superfamily N-acetyltransferase
MSILHFRKQFAAPPAVVEVPGIRVRTYTATKDVQPWLRLRSRATAELSPPVRSWSTEDFRHEMLNKTWWRDDYTWLAEAGDSAVADSLAGAVSLALRHGTVATVPVVHWLLVDPAWRRRGIARLLMSHLETAAWHAGNREVQLETHAKWHAAIRFYQSIGYAPLRARSPR